uniref:Reverse transcriptase N-terminal domain-containing protein n=1 Tax=Sporolithon durum TaxID=48970 RepID=A0A141SCQ8_9FLOR|nr:hypothetical protein Sdur_016 [Sporolithon durum]AMK96076.1 hypothetical protein Sdur_016 [Sporolithon durum]
MSMKLARNFNTIVWKYIYWIKLNKYVYYLKSRIYKALVQNYYKKAYYLQVKLISSPLVKILALKKILYLKQKIFINDFHLLSNTWRDFHIGYLSNYLNFDDSLDVDILLYKESKLLNTQLSNLFNIFKQIRELLTSWVLEVYLQSFYDTKSKNYFRFSDFQANFITNFANLNSELTLYSITIELKSIFYFMSTDFLLTKLNINQKLRHFLADWLLKGKLINIVRLLHSIKYGLNYEDIELYIGKLLIDFTILILFDEIKFMLQADVDCNNKLLTENFYAFSNDCQILLLSNNYTVLKKWQYVYWKWLVSNGVQVLYTVTQKITSCFEGNYLGKYFITYESSKFCKSLFIKPSLYAQFCLLRDISIIIKELKGKSFFLLIIQLNKFLLYYSRLFLKVSRQNIFSLLDYLIYLKLKAYIINMDSGLSHYKIKAKYFPSNQYCFNNKIQASMWIMSSLIRDSINYKLYFLIKLSWFSE